MLDQILVFRLRRIRDLLASSFRQRVTEGKGLKPGDFTVLALIEANPAISQIDLAKAGGFDQANLVSILDDLENHGWAIRERDKLDRRRHCVVITKDGRRHLQFLMERARENEERARSALTPRELAAFEAALRKIHDALVDDIERS